MSFNTFIEEVLAQVVAGVIVAVLGFFGSLAVGWYVTRDAKPEIKWKDYGWAAPLVTLELKPLILAFALKAIPFGFLFGYIVRAFIDKNLLAFLLALILISVAAVTSVFDFLREIGTQSTVIAANSEQIIRVSLARLCSRSRKLIENAQKKYGSKKIDTSFGVVRANIMVPIENGQKLKVVFREGMTTEADIDINLTIASSKGVAGKAYRQRRIIFGDVNSRPTSHNSDEDQWGFTAQDWRKCRHDLKWIISIPLFGQDGSVVAVLNLDSNVTLKDVFNFEEHPVVGRIAFLAEGMGRVLARLVEYTYYIGPRAQRPDLFN